MVVSSSGNDGQMGNALLLPGGSVVDSITRVARASSS